MIRSGKVVILLGILSSSFAFAQQNGNQSNGNQPIFTIPGITAVVANLADNSLIVVDPPVEGQAVVKGHPIKVEWLKIARDADGNIKDFKAMSAPVQGFLTGVKKTVLVRQNETLAGFRIEVTDARKDGALRIKIGAECRIKPEEVKPEAALKSRLKSGETTYSNVSLRSETGAKLVNDKAEKAPVTYAVSGEASLKPGDSVIVFSIPTPDGEEVIQLSYVK